MITHTKGSEWLPRPLAIAAIVAAVVAFGIHGSVGFRGAYLTYVGGVWLTLARDLSDHGVLFRDLVSDLGYGGTRYFPLFLVTISFFLKLGASVAAAGWLAGVTGLSLLATGAYRIARASAVSPLTAAVFAAAAAVPYFALQAVFEVKADVMAAGLNLWGVALLLPAWRTGAAPRPLRVWPAAVLFALAFATKITALTIPGAMVVAAVLTGRTRVAARFSATLAAVLVAFLVLVEVASAGRALKVWAATMFAGSDSAGTLEVLLSGNFLPGLFSSHLVIVAGVVAVAMLIAAVLVGPAGDDGLTSSVVPVAVWLGASLALGVTLSAPGTVPSNQVIEWIACSLLVPAMVAGSRLRLQRIAGVAIAGLVLWMAAQNISRAWEMREFASAESLQRRQQFVERVRRFDGPILAESALWPLLAGREVTLPDPFAARVVLRSHPDIENVLIEEISRRKYVAVILEFDPSSTVGRGMYEYAHFSRAVISAVEANYQLVEQPLPNAFVLTPRAPRAVEATAGR